MAFRLFDSRLKKELPNWVEKGLISQYQAQAIMTEVAGAARGHSAALAFYLLGALLLGTGTVTWVAANWDGLGRLARLLLLFGGLWASLGGAWWAQQRRDAPWLAQGLVLLAVIIFGANIMLIAQTYHISAHYPNGVLLWAVGAFVCALLLNSQPALVAGLGLALLWSGMESSEFYAGPHWPFLPVWLGALALVAWRRWHWGVVVLWISLVVWGMFMFGKWEMIRELGGPALFMQIWLLVGVAVYVGAMRLGERMENTRHGLEWHWMTQSTMRIAAMYLLITGYVLTFPDIHREGFFERNYGDSTGWHLGLLGLCVLLAGWNNLRVPAAWLDEARVKPRTRPTRGLRWGDPLLALTGVLMLANLWWGAEHPGWVALGYNLIYFAALAWLVHNGYSREDRGTVNIAFAFFALIVLTRYFDYFWDLLHRSYFFMAGGVLLMGGGLLLERQRRRLMARMQGEKATDGQPLAGQGAPQTPRDGEDTP